MNPQIIEDLRWFFSTIAQTLGAIVAIVGMVCIYRLQSIYNSRWDIMNKSLRSRLIHFDENAHDQNAQDFIEAWLNYKEDQLPSHLTDLGGAVVGLRDLLHMQAEIKFRLIVFLIVNLTIILGFIVALPFSEFLSAYRERVIFVAVVFVITSLFLTVWLSYALIPPGRKREEWSKN